jgi:pre-rRNA-processing protein RIX1
MAPMASELATLRALSFRISSTPTLQLPQHVPAIAASLANCRTLLSSPQVSGTKATSSEASVAIHKYRTLLSTLLQDRTSQGRWSAVVLIKATLEVGGWETLQKSLPWVRGLLGFLNKPDPPSSKKLCIITLTRLFLLTREYPTLIREITTPSLPAFLQSCLQIVNTKTVTPTLLQIILGSFNELLPRHPTIFRSYLKQLHPLLARLIAPTPSSKTGREEEIGTRYGACSEITAAARQLYVQLPCCAPKGASSEEWTKSLKFTVNNAHQTADRVFRAVLEDYQPTSREAPSVNGHTLDDEVQDLESETGLPSWSGIFAGSERLTGLLRLVKEYLENPTSNQVYLSIGMMVDLVSRLLAVTVPASSSKNFENTVRMNAQVSREERESLWLLVPDVHVATIEVLLALAHRSQASTLALDPIIIDQLVWVFGAEKDTASVRTACYTATAALLKRSGMTLPKSIIDSLKPLIRACCDDLLPSETTTAPAKQTPGQAKANGNSQPQATANADTFLNSSKITEDPAAAFAGLKEAAYDLLPVLLANIRAQYLSDSMRSHLDRTAIITQHKDAMVASVLNQPSSKNFGKPATSILPLMARSFPAVKDVEGMLRPRMPVIRLGGQDVEMEDGDEDLEDEEEQVEEEEEEEEKEDEELDGLERSDSHFVGQELDDLLENAGQAETDFAKADVPTASTSADAISTPVTRSKTAQTYSATIPEPTQFLDTAKRPICEGAALSPSKRTKTREDEPHTADALPPIPAVVNDPVAASVSTGSKFTATSTASAAPVLPSPGEAGLGDADSDSDDGKISLVLGQDTDDESD